MIKYIEEATLFGHSIVFGFGDDNFYIKEINRDIANKNA